MAKDSVIIQRACLIAKIFHRFGHDSEFVQLCGDFTAMYLVLEKISEAKTINEVQWLSITELNRLDRLYGVNLLKR